MKTKVSVKDKICAALLENEGDFLSVEQLAQNIYKEAYMKETSRYLNGLVQRNVIHAIAMLHEDGHLVLTLKEPTKNGKKMTRKKVLGYKIADKEDSTYVLADLKTKKERLEIAYEKKQEFESQAYELGLIEYNNTRTIDVGKDLDLI